MRVRFTPTGRSQFLAALSHIRKENPTAARNLHKRAKRVLKRLERFPESGRALPEFPELPYREVIVTPYRFFYRAVNNIVWVVAVWHGAQIPEMPTEDRPANKGMQPTARRTRRG
ncbi:MAG TPA: type II toxin-antitoxin system RelE/ParE family toxin [Candidatus Binatia bacterium]